MFRTFSGLLLLIFALPCSSQTPNWEFLKQGVVKVVVGTGPNEETGTGIVFYVAPGVIRVLTAKHVLRGQEGQDATTARVYFYSDPVVAQPAQVLERRSDTLDLAVLEAHPAPTARLPKFPKYQWLGIDDLRQGEQVWTMDGEWNVVPNTITRLDSDANPEKFQYTSTSIGTGFSGGPVFTSGGFLIGMHDAATGGADGAPSYGVAIKIAPAFASLDALGYKVETSLGGVTHLFGTPNHDSGSVASGSVPTGTPARPKLWRNITNNHTYTFQADGNRLYIRENNNVVGDLVLTKDKKGMEHFEGRGSISNCPNGTGYIVIDSIDLSRIEGRVEMKPPNANCGGIFGRMRTMASEVWLLQP